MESLEIDTVHAICVVLIIAIMLTVVESLMATARNPVLLSVKNR